jgi:hypothetical protein
MDVMVRYNDGPGMVSPMGVVVYFGGHLQDTKEAGGMAACVGYLSRDGQVKPEVHNPDLWREVGWDPAKTDLPPPELLRQLSMGYDLHGTKLTQGQGLFRSPKEALITLPGELSASLKNHPDIALDILRETVQAHLREVEREAVRVRTGGGNREWQEARTLSLYYIHAENRGGEVHFHAHTMTFIPAQMPDGSWRSWDNGRNMMRLSKPGGGREKMTDAMLATVRKHGLEIELKRGVASLAPGQAQGATVKGLDGRTIEAGSLDRKRRVEILAAQELKQELGGIAPLTPRELEIVRKVSGKLAIQDLSGERRRLALAEKLNALGMLGDDGRILPKVELVEKLKVYEQKLALAQVQLEAGISLPIGEKFRAAAQRVQKVREQVASIAGPELDLGASTKAARIRWTKDYQRVLGMVQEAGGLSTKDLDKRDRDLLSKLKKSGLLEAQKVGGLNEYRLTESGLARLGEVRVSRSEVVRAPGPGLPADLRLEAGAVPALGVGSRRGDGRGADAPADRPRTPEPRLGGLAEVAGRERPDVGRVGAFGPGLERPEAPGLPELGPDAGTRMGAGFDRAAAPAGLPAGGAVRAGDPSPAELRAAGGIEVGPALEPPKPAIREFPGTGEPPRLEDRGAGGFAKPGKPDGERSRDLDRAGSERRSAGLPGPERPGSPRAGARPARLRQHETRGRGDLFQAGPRLGAGAQLAGAGHRGIQHGERSPRLSPGGSRWPEAAIHAGAVRQDPWSGRGSRGSQGGRGWTVQDFARSPRMASPRGPEHRVAGRAVEDERRPVLAPRVAASGVGIAKPGWDWSQLGVMAGLAALEIHRRRKCELEAQVKAVEVARVAELAKLRVELPGPEKSLEKSLEKTLLDKPFKRGIRLGR